MKTTKQAEIELKKLRKAYLTYKMEKLKWYKSHTYVNPEENILKEEIKIIKENMKKDAIGKGAIKYILEQ